MSAPRPKPRDYVDQPLLFGRSREIRWIIPPVAGSDAEQVLAMTQHAAALAIHHRGDTTAARRVSARFGFSVQTWSDYLLGKSWMAVPGFAAATALLLEQLDEALR
jgi:hypothetical protein